MSPKDMYADLEKIEARGKRKKEKRGGLFSSFGKKDEPEQENPPQPSEPASSPATVPAAPEPKPVAQPIAQPTPQPKPKSIPQPVAQPASQPKPEPMPQPIAQPVPPPKSEPRQEPVPQKPAPVIPENKSGWKPLTGSKLEMANANLHEYKKWLNKGYKSGVLTKDQCTDMVMAKEIELGLRPPE